MAPNQRSESETHTTIVMGPDELDCNNFIGYCLQAAHATARTPRSQKGTASASRHFVMDLLHGKSLQQLLHASLEVNMRVVS